MGRRSNPWYDNERKIYRVVIDGKRHPLGPDKQRAHERFHQLMSQPRRQIRVVADAVASVFEAFLEHMQVTRSPGTFEWYRGRLKRFHESHPDMLVADLKPHHVEDWATKPGQSVTTKSNNMRTVKRALKWAVSRGHLDSSPIASMEIPAGAAREGYVSQEEFERLLEYVIDPGFLDLLVFVMQTG